MKVSVALALLVSALFAGCSSSDGTPDEPAHDDLALTAPPVLYLNLTIGNETHRFTTAASSAGAASGSHSSGHAANSSANATGTSASGNTTKTNSTAGNATAGNATGNATAPGGLAPLNVTATLGAKGLPAGKAVSWTLDFGGASTPAGNATGSTGNATAGAGNATAGNATKGNATAKAAGPANGTKVPATLNHTYAAAGAYNVTFTLRVANGTPVVLRTILTVTSAADNATGNATVAFGPPPEAIVITGTITGVNGVPGSVTKTFDLLVPVATMTITLTYNDPGGEGAQDIDWHITGPGGETGDGTNFGAEDPQTFELPTVGTWSAELVPFIAINTAYTITVTFV